MGLLLAINCRRGSSDKETGIWVITAGWAYRLNSFPAH